jgi:hypothetical protein
LLKAEVEMEADKQGHELDQWEDNQGWARVRCSNCGASGTASDAPMAGVPRANFRAFSDRPCK